jgi:glycosyltransferase involved in cell wall biosynthesis
VYTVVVPTFNRPKSLQAALDSLLAQDIREPYEVIVVDNNSSDATRSVVEAVSRTSQGKVRYVLERRQGASVARNSGIAASRGEIVAFVDDDVVASPSWLRCLVDCFRTHPEAWVVGGRILLQLPEIRPSWFDESSSVLASYLGRLDRGSETCKMKYPYDIWEGNLAIRRLTLSQIGAFNTNLGRTGTCLLSGEGDELLSRIHRAGGIAYYCGRSVVTHSVPLSRLTRNWFRRRAYGQGRTDVIIKDLESDSVTPKWLRGIGIATELSQRIARVPKYYIMGDTRHAFELELAAWKRAGMLQEVIAAGKKPKAQTLPG